MVITLALLSLSGCDGDTPHPPGWEAPAAHGAAAKLQDEVCTGCHGAELDGTPDAGSCDSCHEAGWRTDCTYCHGGVDNATGAPPEGIRDEIDAAETSYPRHSTHVEATALKSAFDCVECHVRPTDILSAGHIFVGDATPGAADVTFAAGLSRAATWDGNGTCSNLYCHGNGQGDNGSVEVTAAVACGDCHAVTNADGEGWAGMSGQHQAHLVEGLRCAECHGNVVNDEGTIVDVAPHVNGEVDLQLMSTIVRTGDTCDGSCHNAVHDQRSWVE